MKLSKTAAQVRGTGIAKRSVEYIISKMETHNAVIALEELTFAGFCYIETWSHDKFVANSGLIVHPDFRNQGLAKKIKKVVFEHSRTKYPTAKIFSITTGLAVMKLNTALGYKPVTFSELTDEPSFWKGCQTCKNYDVFNALLKVCVCVRGCYMIQVLNQKPFSGKVKEKTFLRLKSIKQSLFLKKHKK